MHEMFEIFPHLGTHTSCLRLVVFLGHGGVLLTKLSSQSGHQRWLIFVCKYIKLSNIKTLTGHMTEISIAYRPKTGTVSKESAFSNRIMLNFGLRCIVRGWEFGRSKHWDTIVLNHLQGCLSRLHKSQNSGKTSRYAAAAHCKLQLQK